MFGKFIPRETCCFDYFEESAKLSHEAAGLLRDLTAKDGSLSDEEIDDAARSVKELELKADRVADACINKLHETFITPFDRASMFKLMKKLDDIMDYINAAAQRFVLFDIHTFRHELRDLAAVLYEATELLCETVPLLRSMKNDEQIRKNCAAIAIIENKGDGIRRRGLMRLFKEEKDAIQIIKWKEILEKFERTIDTCEHTANVISGIVVEAS